MTKEMKGAFEEWIEEEDPFPDLAIEWDHYSPETTTVFFRAEGEWTLEIRKRISEFLRQYKKKALAGRLITNKHEKEEI